MPFNNTKTLHIEPTTMCNAGCPQCARYDSNRYNDKLNRHELTVEQIKNLFSEDFIRNLDKMFMCGTFGDPAVGKNTIEIFKYFRAVNPEITLGMNTNGSVQRTSWWSDLGKLFSNPRDYCVFSIDGLEDTNPIYRIGTDFKKIISNASAFIQAGGSAHWDMLVFKHNQHQVDQAFEIAKSTGFNWFRAKVSNRFLTNPIIGLEAPDGHNVQEPVRGNDIKCYADEVDKSLYVAANGKIYPCCWIGNYIFNLDDRMSTLISKPGYPDLVKSFTDNPHQICVSNCGKVKNNKTVFETQWVLNEQIK